MMSCKYNVTLTLRFSVNVNGFGIRINKAEFLSPQIAHKPNKYNFLPDKIDNKDCQ